MLLTLLIIVLIVALGTMAFSLMYPYKTLRQQKIVNQAFNMACILMVICMLGGIVVMRQATDPNVEVTTSVGNDELNEAN